MKQLQLRVSIGLIVFDWIEPKDAPEQITGIHWKEWHSPGTNRGFLLTSRRVPKILEDWLERFWNYFEYGRPLGEIPWEQLDQTKASMFQWDVYKAIAMIPHGETRSYGWVAERLRKPQAGRAVGQALRHNPFPVLVPCHRVVTSQGTVGGFMGKKGPNDPELQLKKRLLDLEYTYRNPVFPFLTQTFDPIVGLAKLAG